jgi:hypothetical protein
MAITRGSHFGSSFALPDASLAIFLLAGFFMPRFSLVAMLTFLAFLFEAGSIDYYAINAAGVDDYCVTPAYLFLIPTYATMWLGGSWFAKYQKNSLSSLALFGGVACVTSTFSFLISNFGFFLFAGRFADMSMFEYASRVAQYYPPYLSGSLLYLALAAVAFVLLNRQHQSSADAVPH